MHRHHGPRGPAAAGDGGDPAPPAAVQTCLDKGDLAAALQLLGADDLALMSGLDGLDPALDDWLFVERERWSQAVVADLARAMRDGGWSRKELLTAAGAMLRAGPL